MAKDVKDAFGVESGLVFEDTGIALISGDAIPSANGGLDAPINSYYFRTTGMLYVKRSADPNDWYPVYDSTSGQTASALDQKTPTGFVNRVDSTISFDNDLRQFHLHPQNSTYTVYVKGKRFVKNEDEHVTLDNAEGLHYVYVADDGQLTVSRTGFTYGNQAPVALVYWSAVNQKMLFMAERRHGITMDWTTNEISSRTQGLVYESGLSAISYVTDGDGSHDAHAQISFTNGALYNGDIRIHITHSAQPDARYEQILNGPAQLPIGYNAPYGAPVYDPPSDAPLKLGESGRPVYTRTADGVSTIHEAPSGSFIAMWIFANEHFDKPITSTPNLGYYESLDQARSDAVWQAIVQTDNLIAGSVHFRPIYRLIFEVNDSFTNSYKAALRDVTDIRAMPLRALITHTGLGDLSVDSHRQYLHLDSPRIITATHSFDPTEPSEAFTLGPNAQGQLIGGLNADYLDGHHSSDFQPHNANLTALSSVDGAGVYVVAGDGTSTTRSVVGQTDEIVVVNSAGVDGNITVGISDNAVLPGTQGIVVPSGAISDRPASPVAGTLRYNTTEDQMEYYGLGWTGVGQLPFEEASSPHGFVDRYHTVMSFDDGTRTFTITPAPNVDKFVVYVKGRRFVRSAPDTVQIPDSPGAWFVSYDMHGALVALLSPYDLESQAPVSIVYWSSLQQKSLPLAEERHGAVMDWATHKYLHDNFGTAHKNGLDVINHVLSGDGTSDAHAQFSITNGTIVDEDIEINIRHSNSPDGEFEQVLSPTARFPVYYFEGEGLDIMRSVPDQPYAFLHGTNGALANQLIGGVWTLVEPPSTGSWFVSTWLVATNGLQEPILCSVGSQHHSTLDDALSAPWEAITSALVTSAEYRPLYRLTFETNASFTSTTKTVLRDVTDLRQTVVVRAASSSGDSHSSLDDLTSDDHPQYVHVTDARTITAQHTIAPNSQQPPFVLGVHARGQKVDGLNADLLDGLDSTSFQRSASALSALSTTGASAVGLYAVTGAGTSATRAIIAPGSGMTVSNADGVSGNPTLSLSDDLAAVENLNTAGISVRTGDSQWTTRQITAPTAGLTVSNGTGVSGNPAISLSDDVAAIESLAGTGMAVRTGTNTWATRSVFGTANQLSVSNGDGVAGNVTVSIASNPALPGNAAVTVPVGTTAQRPGIPSSGMVRYNTNINAIEAFENGQWTSRQPAHVNLTALSNAAGAGLYAVTSSGASATRSLIGTSNQIAVVNGSAAAGNPTISLASNPVIPGNSSVTVPVGTTAQRPSSPINGMIRYNTTLNCYEGYINGVWLQLDSPAGSQGAVVRNLYVGTIAPASGTSTISYNNTRPLVTEGIPAWSHTVTPVSSTSRFMIFYSLWISSSSFSWLTPSRSFLSTTFANSTCISVAGCSMSESSDPNTVSHNALHTVSSTAPVTFSGRCGMTSSGSTSINQSSSGGTLGGVGTQYIIIEVA